MVYHDGGSGALPIGGLIDGHSYYVIVLDPSTIKLAATYNNAVSGTPIPASVTAVDTSTNQITLSSSSDLGLYTGEAVVYSVGSGTAIGGLKDGTTYYVIDVDATHIMLADSLNDANAGSAITLTSAGTGTTILVPTSSTPIALNYAGSNLSQTLTPLNIAAGASFTASSTSVTLPGSTTPDATVAISQNLGTLTMSWNDPQFTLTGGSAESSLFGPDPTVSSESITGSQPAAATTTIMKGSNDTLSLTVNGNSITVTLKPGNYTPDALAKEAQTAINSQIASSTGGATVTNAITLANPHGLTTGQEVVYHSNETMTVTLVNGMLTLNSNGPAIKVSGTAGYYLFGNSPTTSNSGTTITATSAAANPTTITSGNDILTLTVNGTPLKITLTQGSYTPAALAVLLQQEINDVGGLTDGYTYYVIAVNDDTIQLASSLQNAYAGNALTLGTSPGYGAGQSFTPTVPASVLTFGPSAVTTTNSASDEISVASTSNLATGDAVIYQVGDSTSTSIGGLTNGQTYYVIAVNATHIKLAATFNDAVNNDPVALTAYGTGASQSLVVEPTQFEVDGMAVPLPVPISGQLVSVAAAGAGGTSKAGAGAVNLNFVHMDVDAHISDNSSITAGGEVDVEANDASKIGSGTGSVAISVSGSTAVNASIGVNDIANIIKAYVEGSTVHSTGGDVKITATESAQDINVVVGGAASAGGNAFGGSFALNFITNTVDAHIASGLVGTVVTPSTVTASGKLSVLATDTASIATLAGNIGASLGGSFAGAAAVAVNDIQDTDTATIDDSTASSGGDMEVKATFGKPTDLPAGLDVQIAAMAVSGAGAGTGAFAGSLSLNWIDNTVEARVSNVAAPQYIDSGGKLSVLASDSSTIDSLAGAVAIAGIGASGSSVAVGASVAFNYLGGDPNDPTSKNHNVVRAVIENVTGSLTAGQIDVSTSYTGQINNITVAGAAAVGEGLASVAVGGAVSINIIHDTSDAHISGSPEINTTTAGADSLDVEAGDSSTIQALAGGVGIAISTGTIGIAVGVSVAVNDIGNTIEAYVDGSAVTSAGDVNVTATSNPTIKALTIGVAVAAALSSNAGGVAGSGAGAGSGDTVRNTVLAYINGSHVTSTAGAIEANATDNALIQTIAGALGIGVAVGSTFAVGASIGISVAVNDVQDNVQAYIDNSTVTATGTATDNGVTLTANETATIDAWTIGGAVGVGVSAGALGIGIGAAAPAPATPSATSSLPISRARVRSRPRTPET